MRLYVVKGRRMKMHFRSVSCIFAIVPIDA